MTHAQLLEWFNGQRKRYPHTCKTMGQLFPRPESHALDSVTRLGDFIRVPQRDHALWAFETEAAYELFRQRYITEDIT